MRNARKRTSWEKPNRREVVFTTGVTYATLLALSNIALTATIHGHVEATREYARSDELSRDTSQVVSELAGYAIDAACTYKVNQGREDGSDDTTLGAVVNYKLVDPFFNPHEIALNPKAMRLHPAVCKAIVRPEDYVTPREARQDAAVAYSVILHEITHLEHPSFDETATQCEAIDIMPSRLEAMGYGPRYATWAARFADRTSQRRLPDEYLEYECS